MSKLQTLGVSSCLGGSMRFCGYAAEMLRNEFNWQNHGQRLKLQWHMLRPSHRGSKEKRIAALNQSISQYTECWVTQYRPFLVIGGDHSCAMGTWGGVINGLKPEEQLGLIWLDAHMDAHTFATSPSGNVHGMPLAALLGKADEKLAAMYPGRSFIKPENVILIGVRSYEKEEYALLDQAKVQIIFADQIVDLRQTLLDAIATLSRSCQTIGISIDLDCIDPKDAPGVETPAENGLKAGELIRTLSSINKHKQVCALEISEFNPEKDCKNKTLHVMKAIVEAFFSDYDLADNKYSKKLPELA